MGIRAGYCVTKIFHFRHKIHTAVSEPKKAERDSGGPEEIIPPPLILRSAARFWGGPSRSLDQITQMSGISMMTIAASQGKASESFLGCPCQES